MEAVDQIGCLYRSLGIFLMAWLIACASRNYCMTCIQVILDPFRFIFDLVEVIYELRWLIESSVVDFGTPRTEGARRRALLAWRSHCRSWSSITSGIREVFQFVTTSGNQPGGNESPISVLGHRASSGRRSIAFRQLAMVCKRVTRRLRRANLHESGIHSHVALKCASGWTACANRKIPPKSHCGCGFRRSASKGVWIENSTSSQ